MNQLNESFFESLLMNDSYEPVSFNESFKRLIFESVNEWLLPAFHLMNKTKDLFF